MHLAIGRKGGIRPADLVGAIANESGLSGRDIGPIRNTEHSSVVGVPVGAVDSVIDAMRNAVVRGKPVAVRRYSEEPRGDRTSGGRTSWRPQLGGARPRSGGGSGSERPVRTYGGKPGRPFSSDQRKRSSTSKPAPGGRPKHGSKGD